MKKQSLSILPKDFTILDTETMGGIGLPTEIGMVKVRNWEIIAKKEIIIKQDQYMIDKSRQWGRIYTHELDNFALNEYEACVQIENFIQDDVIVGSNVVGFDLNVLDQLFSKNNYYFDDLKAFNIAKLSKSVLPYSPSHSLPFLSKYFHLRDVDHTALNDCISTYDVIQKLKYLYSNDDEIEEIITDQLRNDFKKSLRPKKDKYIECEFSNKKIYIENQFCMRDKKRLYDICKKYGIIISLSNHKKVDYIIRCSFHSKFIDEREINYNDFLKRLNETSLVDSINDKRFDYIQNDVIKLALSNDHYCNFCEYLNFFIDSSKRYLLTKQTNHVLKTESYLIDILESENHLQYSIFIKCSLNVDYHELGQTLQSITHKIFEKTILSDIKINEFEYIAFMFQNECLPENDFKKMIDKIAITYLINENTQFTDYMKGVIKSWTKK